MTILSIIEIVLKVTILIGCAGLFGLLLKGRRPAASHMLWLIVLLGSVLLPLVIPLVEGRTVVTLPAEVAPAPVTIEPAPADISQRPLKPAYGRVNEPSPSGSILPEILAGIWAVGFLAVAARYVLGILSLRRLSFSGSRPFDLSDLPVDANDLALRAGLGTNWELRQSTSPDPATAMTWGVAHPVILLPQEADGWSAERLEAVLLHEFAHVRRCDFASQLLAEVACALYWFNPIVWLGARAMRADAELAADDAVVRSGVTPSAYASELLQIAADIGNRQQALSRVGIPVMNHSKIESRLQSVLSPSARHRGVTMPQALVAVVLAGIAVSGIASLHVARLPLQNDRPTSERTAALINAKNIGIATLMYAEDFDTEFPYAQTTATAKAVLAPYVKNMSSFDSPTKGAEFRYNLNIGGVSYKKVNKPVTIPLWTEFVPGGTDQAVVYVDGHARMVYADGQKALESALARKFPRRPGSRPFPKTYAPKLR